MLSQSDVQLFGRGCRLTVQSNDLVAWINGITALRNWPQPEPTGGSVWIDALDVQTAAGGIRSRSVGKSLFRGQNLNPQYRPLILSSRLQHHFDGSHHTRHRNGKA